MTTVTLDTLSNTASIFIRDCLRNNLTDRQGTPRAGSVWIFKGQPENLTIDYPYVILEMSNESDENITINGENTINDELRFHIEVWANKMDDRDILADQIVTILKNVNSQDSNNDSLSDKSLIFMSSDKTDQDTYKTDTELIRIKFIDVVFQYIGS